MKRGIPRAGGIPRAQPGGSRLPQVRPVVVAKTPIQVARRVIAPPVIAPKVRSAPMISAAPIATTRIPAGRVPSYKPTAVVRKIQAPRQTSFGFTRPVSRAAPVVTVPASTVVTPVASPVVTVPAPTVVTPVASPVVTVPASTVVTPVAIPASPVRVLEPIAEPVVLPCRTPVIFPRKRFGYTDPKNEFFNQPPTPIYNESVLLQSPKGRSVVLDVSVNPRPVVVTESGEHVVCDVSLNVRDPPMSLVPNRVPRPGGYIRQRRRRARKAPDALTGDEVIPATPSSVRDYAATPLSSLKRRRFARRILEEGPTGSGFYKLVNTRKIRFPVSNELDTSIEWEPKDVGEGWRWMNLLSPFKETNLITFSPDQVPITADLIQFS